MGIALQMARSLAIAVRFLYAAMLTVLLMGLACAGLFVSTAPEAVSVMVEPFSLLLMPGLLVALGVAGQHDFSPTVVLVAAAVFYFVFFYAALGWWARRGRAGSASG